MKQKELEEGLIERCFMDYVKKKKKVAIDKKETKYRQVVKVLHDNFCRHLRHMKSAEEAAESLARELGRFIETGTMSRKMRSFVKLEIRHNWEDYAKKVNPACDKKTLKATMADGDCQAEKDVASKCLYEWNGICQY